MLSCGLYLDCVALRWTRGISLRGVTPNKVTLYVFPWSDGTGRRSSPEINLASRSQSSFAQTRVYSGFRPHERDGQRADTLRPRIRLRFRARDSSTTTTDYLGEEMTTKVRSHRETVLLNTGNLCLGRTTTYTVDAGMTTDNHSYTYSYS